MATAIARLPQVVGSGWLPAGHKVSVGYDMATARPRVSLAP